MTIPLVLSESTVRPFKFKKSGTTHAAIMYGGLIYKLDSAFSLSQCAESFQTAQILAEECKVVLTTGMFHHRVWVEIKS